MVFSYMGVICMPLKKDCRFCVEKHEWNGSHGSGFDYYYCEERCIFLTQPQAVFHRVVPYIRGCVTGVVVREEGFLFRRVTSVEKKYAWVHPCSVCRSYEHGER